MLYHLDSWSICNSVHKNTCVFDFWLFLGVSLVFGTSKITRNPPYDEKFEKLSDCGFRGLKRRVLMNWMQWKKRWLSAKYRFRKIQEKLPKIVIFFKIENFFPCFLIFSEPVVCRDLRFFVLHSVHQTPSFELSKSTIRELFRFSIIRGDPCDLGRHKNWRHP